MSAVFLVSKGVDVPGICKCSWCLKLLKFPMSAVFLVSAMFLMRKFKVVDVPDVCSSRGLQVVDVLQCSLCLKLLMFLMSTVLLVSKFVEVPDVCSAPDVQNC